MSENLQSHDPNELDINNIKNGESSIFSYDRRLRTSITESFLRDLDIPEDSIEPIILDTSLPYIPIYAHLKMYDLKPIERPKTPPLLAILRSKALSSRENAELLTERTEETNIRESLGIAVAKENRNTSEME
ncbi:uncharacterized protein LOC143221947 [Lasioglossum baleicum]|uniref:uncharacterized protein LOC143221947 n=1 Tax=Lasioglossum baleicum TaxID=434251 RepID=UPI003FCDE7F6